MIPEIAVPKSSQIVVNLRAVNTYKAIWGEDALEWKPGRWLNPLPRSVEEARVPGIYSHVCVHDPQGRGGATYHILTSLSQHDVHQRQQLVHVSTYS